jgi:hypothetical protein
MGRRNPETLPFIAYPADNCGQPQQLACAVYSITSSRSEYLSVQSEFNNVAERVLSRLKSLPAFLTLSLMPFSSFEASGRIVSQ